MAFDETVSRYLTDDHARLADLLDRATAGTEAVDLHAFHECDEMVGVRAAAILAELRAAADVRVAKHQDGPLVMPAVRRAILRAGYDPVLLGIAA